MPLTVPETHDIAVETFIYAYPLVLTELTRRTRTNVPSATRDGKAPMNQFGHVSVAPATPADDSVAPEADIARSTLWYDVSHEPLAIRVPDSGGRYYALWMRDMWTQLFAVAGTRNTGTATQIFLLVPPAWRGTPPAGAVVIQSPTLHGRIDVKLHLNGASDVPNVQRFQRALTGTPLSQWGNPYEMRAPSVNTAWEMREPPRDQVAQLSATDFLSLFLGLTLTHPPGADDAAFLKRMACIGIVPGSGFAVDADAGSIQEILETAWHDAQQRIAATSLDGERRDGWRRDATSTDLVAAGYLHRAAIARGGLTPIPADDGIALTADADADGRSLSSDSRYVLRFEPRELPPVRGFWSLTMYDDRHLFAPNAMDRYVIGDSDDPWVNADGSLDLYIQQSPPTPQSASNWLPAPRRGPFSMTLRLYWPGRDVIEGRWRPPIVRRVS